MLDSIWRDLRLAARSLRRNPGFTVTAVLTMALGIGLNVAVFSVLDRLLFRPLPYEAPEQLVLLRACPSGPERCNGAFPSVVADEARNLAALDGIAVAGPSASYSLTREPDGGQPVRLSAVSANLLRVLGVAPIRGRDFRDDDATQKRPVALLSEESWRRRFAASDDIVGKDLWSRAGPVTIVGVLPEGFIPPSWTAPDPAWDGLAIDNSGWATIGPQGSVMAPIARLSPDVTLEAARAELEQLVATLGPALGSPGQPAPTIRDWIRVDPVQQSLFSRFRPTFWLLFGATGVLLLLACANLATLLLAHGRSREREAAISVTLGSSRARLIRGALLESLLLCLLGAAAAIAVLVPASQALVSTLPPLVARYATGLTDLRVLAVAVTGAVVCAILAGAGPSARAARVDLLGVLQRVTSSGFRRRSLGHASLLAVEVALGVVLVLGTVLMLRSFSRLVTESLGFNPDGLYSVTAMPGRRLGLEAGLAQNLQMLEAIERLPGVASAAGADSSGVGGAGAAVDGFSIGDIRGARHEVTSGFFDVMGMRFVAGRALTEAEVAQRAPVAVLNVSAAREVWPDLPAARVVGREIALSRDTPLQVIGVAPDIRQPGQPDVRPAPYAPLGEGVGRFGGEVVLRTATGRPPESVALRERLRERLGPTIDVGVTAVAPRLAFALNDPRFRAVLFTTLGLAALLVAASGLCAVAAFDVRRREYEIGVRLALGARVGAIERMVVAQACRPVLAGVAAGVAGAYFSMSYLKQFLYQVEPRDPSTYLAAAGIMAATAVAAVWVPAKRASHLDPVVALRSQ